MQNIKNKRQLNFDLEGDNIYPLVKKIHCAVAKDMDTGEVFKFKPGEIEKTLEFFDNEASLLVGHNIVGFDFPALKKLYGWEWKGEFVDTIIWSRTFYPKRTVPAECPIKNKPHSVKTWGYRVGRGKPEHNDWEEFSPEMLHRCEEDVEIQTLIYKALLKEYESANWKHASILNHKLFSILQQQEEYGWLVDKEYIERCIRQLDRWIHRIDSVALPRLPWLTIKEEKKTSKGYTEVSKPFKINGELAKRVETWQENTGHPPRIVGPFSRVFFRQIDLNSNVEFKDFLLREGWKPREWNKNKKGEPSSPKLNKYETFEGVDGKLGSLVAKRVQCRHRKSTLEGYLRDIRQDGRLSGSVANLASTGRATHRVIVNVPGGDSFYGKQMRKCFICKKGYKLIGTDSAGCQNRMLAGRVNDDNFTKILLDGKKEDETSIHFINKKAIKKIAGIDVTYHQAKTLNYGFMFGASNNKLGTTIGSSKKEGEKIRKALLSVSTGLEQLIGKLEKEWEETAIVKYNPKIGRMSKCNGYITGLDGRPILVESPHMLLVYLLQSDEAIMMATAYCILYKRLCEDFKLKWGEDWAFVCWYHDEYTIEAKEKYAELIKIEAERAIVDAGKYYKINCPHEGEGKIGDNWWEIH